MRIPFVIEKSCKIDIEKSCKIDTGPSYFHENLATCTCPLYQLQITSITTMLVDIDPAHFIISLFDSQVSQCTFSFKYLGDLKVYIKWIQYNTIQKENKLFLITDHAIICTWTFNPFNPIVHSQSRWTVVWQDIYSDENTTLPHMESCLFSSAFVTCARSSR